MTSERRAVTSVLVAEHNTSAALNGSRLTLIKRHSTYYGTPCDRLDQHALKTTTTTPHHNKRKHCPAHLRAHLFPTASLALPVTKTQQRSCRLERQKRKLAFGLPRDNLLLQPYCVNGVLQDFRGSRETELSCATVEERLSCEQVPGDF